MLSVMSVQFPFCEIFAFTDFITKFPVFKISSARTFTIALSLNHPVSVSIVIFTSGGIISGASSCSTLSVSSGILPSLSFSVSSVWLPSVSSLASSVSSPSVFTISVSSTVSIPSSAVSCAYTVPILVSPQKDARPSTTVSRHTTKTLHHLADCMNFIFLFLLLLQISLIFSFTFL